MTIHIPFDNTYARLPAAFFERVEPTPVAAPRLIKLNVALARELGLDPETLAMPEGAEIFAGRRIAETSEPIALAYAGHQFGQFVPQLGDGRAILLGEVVDANGRRRDIQLKGSGPTPYSRRGDGRAALGPVLREYVVSEAMHALAIPTTRALAAVTTGEPVYREDVLPGAVLTRVAASHIRIGTFQFFAARRDFVGLRRLADYAIARHDPQAAAEDNPYRAFLAGVVSRQAELVAAWMLVGFVHGVMNTDNMSISGETIDYGPCAFMDAYDPATVFSSIDSTGRYAFANQPGIAQWNLTRLAESLLPLLADTTETAVAIATSVIESFADRFDEAYGAGLRRKLGLLTTEDGDRDLAGEFLSRMAAGQADFTLTFRRLNAAALDPAADREVRDEFLDPALFDDWAPRWHRRLEREVTDPAIRRSTMRLANPAVIARNHLVEEAIAAAVGSGDFGPFETLVAVLSAPFDETAENARYAKAPLRDGRAYRTFCGT